MKIESLVVCKPFQNYKKGQKIFQQEKIKEILESYNKNFVVKTTKTLNEKQKSHINNVKTKSFKS